VGTFCEDPEFLASLPAGTQLQICRIELPTPEEDQATKYLYASSAAAARGGRDALHEAIVYSSLRLKNTSTDSSLPDQLHEFGRLLRQYWGITGVDKDLDVSIVYFQKAVEISGKGS
jgi:hypothetical protein